MGRHDATEEGRADDWTSCDGENRADPDSWGDPDIVADAWDSPKDVEVSG